MDGETYEQWVAGVDVDTGHKKGRVRDDANSLRFVEVTVNGPKTWSLVAALHPEISAALDEAQGKAATEIVAWLAQHATTRVGPRGRQVQVPVERIEAAVIWHYTSRAGDPHRHLHLQVNARVWAAGAWRGLHSVGVRDMIEAINGIRHAAVATDPEFRAVLAARGLTLDAETGEIEELAPYVGAFSARTAQIHRNVDRYEAEWRRENPGQEPGPRLRETWDRRAWAEARPDKVVPTDGADLVARWNHELRALGHRDPAAPAVPKATSASNARSHTRGRRCLSSTPSTWILAKQSGIVPDHSRSGTTYSPIWGSSRASKLITGLIASSKSRTPRSRSTTSRVGDLRRDSYSEIDDCCVSPHNANWACDAPKVLRATSITVFGGYTAAEYR